jgi:cysteine desulfurase family protein (TIGR01976 family)
MNFDLDTVRARFPALAIEDDGVPRIYFDNPAGTQVPQSVIDAMNDCLINANANLGGPFETARRADSIYADVHDAMADMLNAGSPKEIVFGQNMTTITLHMSRSIGRLLKPGDEIVLSRMDHDANIAPWLLMARDHELEVRWLPFNTETFEFDDDALDKVLTDKTKLVCVGAASNLLGTVHDVKTICQKARAAGALSYIDAVQYAPHVSTDVQDMGCDFLVCSAYKFFGPHQGILYGRAELLESLEPYKLRTASDEIPGCFETGTQSHEGMAGTTAAVDYFASIGEAMAEDYFGRYPGFDRRRQAVHAALDLLFDYEATLATRLIEGLQQIPGVRIYGITDPAAMDRRVPTVSITVDGHHPDAVGKTLGERGIFCWTGNYYALEGTRFLGVEDSGGTVRLGPVHYNSPDEVDQVLNALSDIASKTAAA